MDEDGDCEVHKHFVLFLVGKTLQMEYSDCTYRSKNIFMNWKGHNENKLASSEGGGG